MTVTTRNCILYEIKGWPDLNSGNYLHNILSRILLSKSASIRIYESRTISLPIIVAARSKARTVFARPNTGIVGSNPTHGMDVRVRLCCVSVVKCR
jgi:hypothetical protein